MLEKLLSISKRLPLKGPKKRKKAKRLRDTSLDPNFYEPPDYPAGDNIAFIKLVSWAKLVIFFTSVIFGVLIIYNEYLDSRLSNLKTKQDTYIEELSAFPEEEAMAKEIDEKVTHYREIDQGRVLFGDRATSVFVSTGEEIHVEEFRIRDEGFTVRAKGESPLEFAYLISRYLDSGSISQVIIKSALLRSSTREFKVELEGVFE